LGFAVIVVLALFGMTVLRGSAQGRPELKRPENIPQEKPAEPKKKKVKGPRAVAILQFTSGGKATLIPIAILVDGKFYDASEYKADPVPMALDSGTVYEAEQSGDSQGLFTVSGALHSKSQGSAHPWVGAGSYLPNGTAAANVAHKAENVPVGLDSSDNDAPPRLTRGNASKAAEPASPGAAPASGAPTSTTPASATPGPTTSGSTTSVGTGSSEKAGVASAPPATSQPANDKQQAPPQSSPSQSSPTQSASGQTPPGQESQAQASSGQASQSRAPQSPEENYYRPTLRRGKPTEAPPPDAVETAPKTAKADLPASAAPAASAEPTQLVPAISDGGGPDPKSYKFFWKTGEEQERRNQMIALAGVEVQAYVNTLARNQIPAKPPAKPATAGHKTAAKPVQPVLENVQFHSFDIWTNNQIVMILSAEAHFPPAPGATAAPEQYSITLVTRTDIYGDLRKLYSGVTDKFHLDVTPRLELIDAVDADGDGRGELLFRETTDAGNGYVIYRAGADKIFKMFDSLGG
jgi:hypothetical protein